MRWSGSAVDLFSRACIRGLIDTAQLRDVERQARAAGVIQVGLTHVNAAIRVTRARRREARKADRKRAGSWRGDLDRADDLERVGNVTAARVARGLAADRCAEESRRERLDAEIVNDAAALVAEAEADG